MPGASLPVPLELLTRCNSDCVTIPHFSQLRSDKPTSFTPLSQPTPHPAHLLPTSPRCPGPNISRRRPLENCAFHLLPSTSLSPLPTFHLRIAWTDRQTLTPKQPGKPVCLSVQQKEMGAKAGRSGGTPGTACSSLLYPGQA